MFWRHFNRLQQSRFSLEITTRDGKPPCHATLSPISFMLVLHRLNESRHLNVFVESI